MNLLIVFVFNIVLHVTYKITSREKNENGVEKTKLSDISLLITALVTVVLTKRYLHRSIIGKVIQLFFVLRFLFI